MKKTEKEALGNLELNIMKILWESGGWLDVKGVVTKLDDPRAYTTIMTTLVRLHKKGFLDQKKIGRAFVYRPRVTQRAVVKRVLARVTDLLFNGDLTKLMPQLIDLDSELTEGQRDRLRAIADEIKDLDKR